MASGRRERGGAWYESAFDLDYLERYAHRDRAEASAFVDLLAERGLFAPGARVLDLCCGAGRHIPALLRHGARPVGLDLSATLLGVARAETRGVPFVRASMRRLPFRPCSFDAVCQFFTAFGYFETDDENRAVLGEVLDVLRPGGRYALDYFNALRVRRGLEPEGTTELPSGGRVRERRWIDEERGRVEKEIVVERPGRPPRRIVESVRLLEPDELLAWLEQEGFRVVDTLGGAHGRPFDADESERLLVLAERPAGAR